MAMKKCKECGEEISSSAKKCPKCGKDQRNFYMKHPVLYTIIILILIGAFASAGNNSNTNTTTTSSKKKKKQETVYAVGDTITNGDYEITIQNDNEAKKVGRV